MLTVYYDAKCPVCVLAMRVARRLDRNRRLRLVSLQHAAEDRASDVKRPTRRRLRAVLHVVDEQGRWFSGGEAMLQIADRIAILRPLALVGRLPVINRSVEPAYRFIANNRHRISRLLRLEGRAFNE